MMGILQRLRLLLFYAGVSPEEYDRIRPDILKNNILRLQVFSGISIAFLLVMTAITFTDPSLNFDYRTYIAPLFFLGAILMAAILLAGTRPRLCKVLVYVFISLMFLFAIVVGTVANPKQTAGTFLAFLLAIPLLFVLRPIENVLLITFYDLIFILASGAIKPRAIFEVDAINALVFGAISMIVSTFMLSITVENFVIKDTLLHLAETDQLTQLCNRTSYERNLPSYPDRCKSTLACVYADVNGLHELNEVKGHEAGDTMLKFVANALREQFGAAHTYRIGGDEYVAFGVDLNRATLEEKLEFFTEQVEAEGYHVSVGWALGEAGNIQLSPLVKAAEDNMYQAKQQFYRENPSMHQRHPRCTFF